MLGVETGRSGRGMQVERNISGVMMYVESYKRFESLLHVHFSTLVSPLQITRRLCQDDSVFSVWIFFAESSLLDYVIGMHDVMHEKVKFGPCSFIAEF